MREAIEPHASRLRDLEKRNALGTPFEAIIDSFAHLHCNRLLRADRRTEQRLLDLLRRVYTGLQYS
jgi:hypothetical protein